MYFAKYTLMAGFLFYLGNEGSAFKVVFKDMRIGLL